MVQDIQRPAAFTSGNKRHLWTEDAACYELIGAAEMRLNPGRSSIPSAGP